MNQNIDPEDEDLHKPLVEAGQLADTNEPAFDLLEGRTDVEMLHASKRTAHHSLIDKKYVMTPGVNKKMIDRETILPRDQVEEKAGLLLDRQVEQIGNNKKSCWSCLCLFGKGKKLNDFLKFVRKKEKENSILNILECLFLEYNQDLVNLLWHKHLECTTKKLVLRDDFSHWIHILL